MAQRFKLWVHDEELPRSIGPYRDMNFCFSRKCPKLNSVGGPVTYSTGSLSLRPGNYFGCLHEMSKHCH